MQLANVPQAEKTERLQWVHDMRSAFSPAAMLAEDGSINQEFFKPSKVIHLAIISASCTSVLLAPELHCLLSQVVLVDDKKWGNNERDLLYQVRLSNLRTCSMVQFLQ